MRKLRTVEEIQEAVSVKTETSGIFQSTFYNKYKLEWILPYCEGLDNILVNEYGGLYFAMRFWSDINITNEQVTKLQTALLYAILQWEYKLKKLINTLDLEYNPLYNVEEDTLETYTGDGTVKNEKKENGNGDQKSNNKTSDLNHLNYGTYQEKTNTTLGERNDSGTVTNTNDYGNTAGQYTTSNNVAPMDSDEFHSDTQNRNNHNEDAHTDTLTQISSSISGAEEDSAVHTINAREDSSNRLMDAVSSISYANNIISNTDGVTTTSYTKHIIRKGNIGVTSSQQLIEQERNIADFSIYKIILDMFVNEFCIGIYVDTDSCACDTEWGVNTWL